MAVKIVRQEKNIALLGVPTSAAQIRGGQEGAPAALRDAGIVARLSEAGFLVNDYGDLPARAFVVDTDHPRARNVKHVLATLEDLRPKIELAVKSGALPLVLGGDASIVLAAVAGARRYFRNVSLIFFNGNAALKEPATTTSGSVDEMIISHVLGRGAPELVRFWGEPPLVRAPDVALFGIQSLDEAEQQFMMRSPLRRYLANDVIRAGAAAAAEDALEQVHGRIHEFVLLVNLNAIAPEDFAAASPERTGGLPLAEACRALAVFARQPTLAALVIGGYNPAQDPEGKSAKQVLDLLLEILAPRLGAPAEPSATSEASAATGATGATQPAAAASGSAPHAQPTPDAPAAAEPAPEKTEKKSVTEIPPDSTPGTPSSAVEIPSAEDAAVHTSMENPQPGAERKTEENSSVSDAQDGAAGGDASTQANSTPDSASPATSVERETPDA